MNIYQICHPNYRARHVNENLKVTTCCASKENSRQNDQKQSFMVTGTNNGPGADRNVFEVPHPSWDLRPRVSDES